MESQKRDGRVRGPHIAETVEARRTDFIKPLAVVTWASVVGFALL